MRVYTEIPEEICLLAVPGSGLQLLEEKVPSLKGYEERVQEIMNTQGQQYYI